MQGWGGTTPLVLLVLLHQLQAQDYHLVHHRDEGNSNDITLHCRINGHDLNAVFWRRPSLDASALKIHTGTEYEFILNQQLEGYYCCGGESSVQPESNCVALPVFPTSLIVNHKDFYVIQLGAAFTSLDCGMRPGALSSFYELSWGRHLNTLSSNINSENFSLSILGAEERDGDEYHCTVTVQGFTRTQEITVLIHSFPTISPDLPVSAVTAEQLPNYTLNCSAYAHTRELRSETVSWQYDGREITDGGKYIITTSNFQSSLTILGAGMVDSGEYKCHMMVSVGDVGNEKETRNVSYEASTLLAFLTDEFQLEGPQEVTGEKFVFCLHNIHPSLHDHIEVHTRFTEANNSASRAYDLTVPPDSFLLTAQERVCFELAKEDIRAEVPYLTAKVQVAVVVEDTRSPFIPELSAATSLVLRTPPPDAHDEEPTTSSDSSSSEIAIAAGIAAVGVVVALVIILIIVIFCVRCRRKARKELNRKLHERIQEHEKAIEEDPNNTEVCLERLRNIRHLEDRIQTEGPEGPPEQGEEPPGQGVGPPGQGEGPPGQGEGPPEQGEEPPGQGVGPPGQGVGPPGQGEDPNTPEAIKHDLGGEAADEIQGNQEDKDCENENHETSLDLNGLP